MLGNARMNVKGQKVVVAGAARTGVEAARLLALHGAVVTLSDAAIPEDRSSVERKLAGLNVAFELGGHKTESFTTADLVILSPGVPPAIEPVRAAEKAGIPVMSELEFAYRYCQSRLVAITGTNGKTTTTTLVHRLLKEAEIPALLAGNNELPFSRALMVKPRPQIIVLEVSSFQLERIETFRPEIAVLLNVTPDHLERYSGMEDYRRAKMRVFAHQTDSDTAILNADDPHMYRDAEQVQARKLFFSIERELESGVFVHDGDIIVRSDGTQKRLARVDDIALIGKHNLANVLATLGACFALDLPEKPCRRTLRAFRGLEHRMEFVVEKRGVTFINDSKGTNIDALEKALVSIDVPVILIAGGRGKKSDYSVLRDLVKSRVKRLVLIGEDAPLMEAAFGDLVPVSRAGSLKEAVQQACSAATKGDCVLLSPACASFDMFRNFEDRGEQFKSAVLQLKDE
jgi:UDP-N-acetylmuramoylalanine--D-glutamate ligase